jgi:hypothetical protein
MENKSEDKNLIKCDCCDFASSQEGDFACGKETCNIMVCKCCYKAAFEKRRAWVKVI